MQLRIFTRRLARAVDPGDILESPRPMKVEEVHKTLTGLKLIGFPTTGANPDKRRVSADLKADDPVEAPVADRDTVIDVLRNAFAALRRTHEDDGVADGDGAFEFSWHPGEGEFQVKLATGGWAVIAFDQPEATKPAAKPTKAARKAASTPPPVDPLPDIAT